MRIMEIEKPWKMKIKKDVELKEMIRKYLNGDKAETKKRTRIVFFFFFS